MSKLDFVLCTASIGLIGMTIYQLNKAQKDASVKAVMQSANVSPSSVGMDTANKTVGQKPAATNLPKPSIASQGELYFGPVTFKDRKSAEAYLRQFQPEGDYEHIVEPDENDPK